MIRTDSRKIKPGDTFVALDGINSNGDAYIEKAIEAGAALIVCREGQYRVQTLNVPDPSAYLEKALKQEYGGIIDKMTLIAVTGTNGKTTTCNLIADALNACGIKCGYIGTNGFYLGEKIQDLPNTSVALADLYDLLLTAHSRGFDTIALEASSQGLAEGRLNTILFDAAVFTNLTEDHLDYHKTMGRYALAKQAVFRQLKNDGWAVINADSEYSYCFLLQENRNIQYGIDDGDVRITEFSFAGESSFTYSAFGRAYKVRTKLLGRHNMYNILAAICVLNGLGIEFEKINSVIENLNAPEGRCDCIQYKGATIVVDYAHTPDAVSNIIECAGEFTDGKMYVVFGCTGDREREKRPVMTRIVLSSCEYAIITDDDVHNESEDQIIEDMLRGNEYKNYEICTDRKAAVHKGIDLLREGDTLLILGKGHEKFIIMKDWKIPYNDKEAVLEYIQGI